ALARLARVDEVRWEPARAGAVGAHAVLKGGAMELFLPLEGVIDLARERARLREEIERKEGQLAGGRGRLANEQFVSRARPDVVEKERERVAGLEEELVKLRDKLALLEGRG